MPNFLANIYIHPSFKGKISDKQKIVHEIYKLIRGYIKTGELAENEIIDSVFSMDHSQISLCPNLEAWWQKKISDKTIISAIKKKENKINNYIRNTNLPQWLLIVIGGVGESSYRFENDFNLKVETKFDKVFLLEDFYNNLFEIK